VKKVVFPPAVTAEGELEARLVATAPWWRACRSRRRCSQEVTELAPAPVEARPAPTTFVSLRQRGLDPLG
jgi:hypothetical protein